jgi:prepilin-type N-terminal cleavage/methylation domain-containing protein
MKKGFTLIELLVVMAIVSILLTIAVPRYSDYILKVRAEEAKSMIMSLSLAQERYHQEIGDYYPNTPNSGSTIVYNENLLSSTLKVDLAESNNFHYSISTSSNGNYTITATLRADIGDDFGKLCTNTTASTKCKKDTSKNIDSWVDSYVRGNGKHYLSFQYPELLSGTDVESGVDFTNLYTE